MRLPPENEIWNWVKNLQTRELKKISLNVSAPINLYIIDQTALCKSLSTPAFLIRYKNILDF